MCPRLLMLAAISPGLLCACANPAKVAAADAMPAEPSVIADTAGNPPPALHASRGLPPWLAAMVADFDTQPAHTAPSTVQALPYLGGTAYLVSTSCCDQFDPLYDAHGVMICHPTGGYNRPRRRQVPRSAAARGGPAGGLATPLTAGRRATCRGAARRGTCDSTKPARVSGGARRATCERATIRAPGSPGWPAAIRQAQDAAR